MSNMVFAAGVVRKYMNQQKLAQVAAQLKKSLVREIVWLRLFWRFSWWIWRAQILSR